MCIWPLYGSLDIGESAALCMFTTGDSSTTGAIMRCEIKWVMVAEKVLVREVGVRPGWEDYRVMVVDGGRREAGDDDDRCVDDART